MSAAARILKNPVTSARLPPALGPSIQRSSYSSLASSLKRHSRLPPSRSGAVVPPRRSFWNLAEDEERDEPPARSKAAPVWGLVDTDSRDDLAFWSEKVKEGIQSDQGVKYILNWVTSFLLKAGLGIEKEEEFNRGSELAYRRVVELFNEGADFTDCEHILHPELCKALSDQVQEYKRRGLTPRLELEDVKAQILQFRLNLTFRYIFHFFRGDVDSFDQTLAMFQRSNSPNGYLALSVELKVKEQLKLIDSEGNETIESSPKPLPDGYTTHYWYFRVYPGPQDAQPPRLNRIVKLRDINGLCGQWPFNADWRGMVRTARKVLSDRAPQRTEEDSK